MAMLIGLVILFAFSSTPVHAATWYSLNGTTTTSPGVIGVVDPSTGNHHRLDVIVRGSDNGIYHRYWKWDGSGWSGWISLNGKTNDQPALAYADYNYVDTLHVVVRGLDNHLYHKKFNIGTATWDASWTLLDPIPEPWYAASAPELVKYSYSGDSLLLFFRATDDYLRYAIWQGGSSNNWIYAGKTWLDGRTLSSPAVNVYQDYIHVVVRGMDNGIYWKNGSLIGLQSLWTINWESTWTKLPGSTNDAPTLARTSSMPYQHLHLIVRGTDNVIYHNAYSEIGGAWWGWDSLGGQTISRPALWASDGPLNVWYLYVRGSNNGIYHRAAYWQGGSFIWNSWSFMDGYTSSGPVIDADSLVVRGTDNTLYYMQWWS